MVLHAVAARTEALGVLHEVGVREADVAGAPELAVLVPLDQAVLPVLPDQHHQIQAEPQRRLELLRVHHEARVAADGHGLAVGVDATGCDRAWQRDPHRGEAVRDDAGVGRLGLVHAGHPHLVGTDVADRDVLGIEHLAQVPDDLLRLQREALVLRMGLELVPDRIAQCLGCARVHRIGALCDRVERLRDVAHHADLEHVVLIDLGGRDVDVHDLLVAPLVPQARVVLDHVVAHAHDHVGHVEAAVHVVVRPHPHRAEGEAMREGDRALGHERGRHGQVQPFDELPQRSARIAADDAVARHHEGPLRGRDHLGGLRDLVRRRIGERRRLRLEGREILHLLLGHVLGQLEEAQSRLLGLGHLEGLAHDLGDDLGPPDLGRVLRDRLEHLHQIEVLVALLVHAAGVGLARDRDDRGAVHVGIGDAGHQIAGARPQGGEAHAGAAGQAAVDVRHEGGCLLVARQDELEIAVEQRLHHVDVLFARDAVDGVDPLVLEATHQELRSLHDRSPPRTTRNACIRRSSAARRRRIRATRCEWQCTLR
jgi:hypothetical protein